MNRCPTGFLQVLLLSFLTTFLTLASSAFAQHEQVYTFTGPNGANPLGGLIVDANGNFYGTAGNGGDNGFGAVFEISQAGNNPPVETLLYSFTGGADGGGPAGNLIFDSAGNLYGTKAGGGDTTNCPLGCGAVYELSPPSQPGGSWTETVLYNFQGGALDGANPIYGVTFDQAGNLYGTIPGGSKICPQTCGMVFEISPPVVQGAPWTETILHTFSAKPDGAVPLAPVIVDQAGNIYGTTASGGMWNQGAVFEISPVGDGTWTESVIHSFEGTRGRYPEAALTFGPKGSLFGTTYSGGNAEEGTVFQLNPPASPGGKWDWVVVFNFGRSQGEDFGTMTPVTFNGPTTMYGTTLGTVFRLSKSGNTWTETTLHTFSGKKDGSNPSGVTIYNGAVYGTTVIGGLQNDGVIFRVSR